MLHDSAGNYSTWEDGGGPTRRCAALPANGGQMPVPVPGCESRRTDEADHYEMPSLRRGYAVS